MIKSIRSLRIKFLVLSMLVLIFMQAFILVFSAGRSYRSLIHKADELLEDIHGEEENASVLNARYFSVGFDRDGEVVSIQVTHIAGMYRKSAVMYARKIQALGQERGFINGYRYRVWQEEDGQATVTFLLRSANLEMLKSNVASMTGVSAAGLGVMFILLIFATRALVRPIETGHRKQKEFITAASHELKTPLTVIGADIAMLEAALSEAIRPGVGMPEAAKLEAGMPDSAMPASQVSGSGSGCSEWIEDIKVQTGRLARLTHELLFLSRLEMSGRSKVSIVFPISDLAEEILHSYQAIAARTRTELEANIAPGLEYCGDENELQHLFTILLDNAFKYCEGERKIVFTLRRAGGIALEVTNTAKPLSKEQLDRVFERFYRGEASRTQKDGFGIGLSIAKAIVENHKGRIRASMQDGDHFCISVLL